MLSWPSFDAMIAGVIWSRYMMDKSKKKKKRARISTFEKNQSR
jgi:hypothetical protein